MMTLPILLAAALLAGAAPPAAAGPGPGDGDLPTVRDVLDRFVTAVGGRTALERLHVRHYRGTIAQDLSWQDPQHRETAFLAEADASGRVRYAETGGWADLPDTNASDLRGKLRWLLHPRYALVVERFFPHLAVHGREVRAGRPVVVLAPRDLDFAYYALYFDEETGLLGHVGYHNDLEDWREEDGVLVPHRWVFGRKGGHTTYVFEEIAAGPAPES